MFTLLDGLDSVPEDAEVFVVLEGSMLSHVTKVHNDVMLYFIVPGMCLHEPISICMSACFSLPNLTFSIRVEMLKIQIV